MTIRKRGAIEPQVVVAAGASVDPAMHDHDASYDALLGLVQRTVEARMHGIPRPVFRVETFGNLYEVFIAHLPAHLHQVHNCRACREFVNRFGSLVVLSETGEAKSLLWPDEYIEAGQDYAEAIQAVRRLVEGRQVLCQFFTDQHELGISQTGPWRHLHMALMGPIWAKVVHAQPEQAMALSREHFGMVERALAEWPLATLDQAHGLLAGSALSGASKFRAPLAWLRDLHRNASSARRPGTNRSANQIWLANASAPEGYKHMRGSALATLLDDIKAGRRTEDLVERWDRVMHPLKYQRPQVAPTAGNIAAAERLVAELGIERSLERRFAGVEDCELLWRPRGDVTPEPSTIGVFASVKPKKRDFTPARRAIRSGLMSWRAFEEDVLPRARAIKVLAPALGNYTAIVTAVHPDAPCLMKYGHHASSYVYHGGSLSSRWGLAGGQRHMVTGICHQPWEWKLVGQPMPHFGEGIVLMIANCVDRQNSNAALFPELMRGDLHAVRSTIEAFSKNNVIRRLGIEGYACGLAFSANRGQRIDVVVFTDTTEESVTIDRWK